MVGRSVELLAVTRRDPSLPSSACRTSGLVRDAIALPAADSFGNSTWVQRLKDASLQNPRVLGAKDKTMACTEQDTGIARQHSCEAGRRHAWSTALSSLLSGLRWSSVLPLPLLCALLQDLAHLPRWMLWCALSSCSSPLGLPAPARQLCLNEGDLSLKWGLSLKQGRIAYHLPGNKFCVPLIHRSCLFIYLHWYLWKLFFLGKFDFLWPSIGPGQRTVWIVTPFVNMHVLSGAVGKHWTILEGQAGPRQCWADPPYPPVSLPAVGSTSAQLSAMAEATAHSTAAVSQSLGELPWGRTDSWVYCILQLPCFRHALHPCPPQPEL